MSFILQKLRGEKKEEKEETQAPENEGLFFSFNPELVAPEGVPPEVLRKAWAITARDAALSLLDESDIKIARWKIEQLADLSYIVIPNVSSPELLKIVNQAISELINSENLRLYSYVRLRRSYKGFERRLSTITAPSEAF